MLVWFEGHKSGKHEVLNPLQTSLVTNIKLTLLRLCLIQRKEYFKILKWFKLIKFNIMYIIFYEFIFILTFNVTASNFMHK